MKSNIKGTILLTALWLGSISQGPAQVISLDSVLRVVQRQNPLLQEYDIKIKALDAYARGAKSWAPPVAGIGPYWYPYPGQRETDETAKGMIMATLEQDIPNPAKLRAKSDFLASRARVTEQERRFAFNNLRAEARLTYYQWIVLEKKLNVLKENERIADLILKVARIRYPYSEGSLSSIYKAEARLHEVQSMITMTTGEIEAKGFQLKALMNLPPGAALQVDTAMAIHFHPRQIFSDTVALHAQRSDVIQIDRTIQSMQLNQRLQRMQAKPDFKIRFEHMFPQGSAMPQQFTLMGMISIPIAPWSSKGYKAEIAGIGYEIDAMKKRREAILTRARGALAAMSAQLIKHGEQLKNYETSIIPALKKNYETVMLAYEENRAQLPVVIDAWEAMNMAQMEYLDQLEEHYLMIANYEKELEK